MDTLMRLLTRLALCAVVSGAMVACGSGLGDQTRNLDIVNVSSQPLIVYTFDRDARFAKRVDGGQTWIDTWMYPLSADDHRLVVVEADDIDGHRVFCARFSYADLGSLKSRIELRPGVNRCD
jgi:hypothetical protein